MSARLALDPARGRSVTAAPAQGVLQRKCACGTHTPGGGGCTSCDGKKKVLQRRAVTADAVPQAEPATASDMVSPGAAADFSRVPSHGHAGAGRPLESGVAARYRPGLGPLVDLVRIHDDASAQATAAREGAVAFTSGADIFFAANAYRPQSETGRNLLAHELAHVWQQHRVDGPPDGYQSQPRDRYEQEADRIAVTGAFTRPDSLQARRAVRQHRTAFEQIATELRNAVEGWGTDEEAIFSALAGRTPAQITEIEAAYLALSGGETLESRLHDELSGDDLARAMSLLRGETAATETARDIWNAVAGLGTDEAAIYAALAGRTAEQWQAIQDAYRQMANEGLIARLQDELTSDEWAHVQAILPGAQGGARTPEDRATVAANQIQHAVDGPGTDEEAIDAALTGRSESELQEIAQRYRLLTSEDLEARLRDELSGAEYERVQLLLHPQALPDRVARELRNAMQGPGTRESPIMAILTGRSPAELTQIRAAYERLYGESLQDRLRDELSGADLAQALQLLGTGILEPADEIHVAVAGLGTDEERLFAVLTEISSSRATIQTTIDRYAAKGFGDMLADIRNDLSGGDLERAMELLHGSTPTTGCTSQRRSIGLEAISEATSMAQNAVARLAADISANQLSRAVTSALTTNFNPGGAANAVTLGLAAQVQPILSQTRSDLLGKSAVTCATPMPMPCGTADPCVSPPDCSRYVAAWTCGGAGDLVRLCEAFFTCASDKSTAMLHEFVHHTGIDDQHYQFDPAYASLTPRGDGSSTDSLNNADSFAYFAKALF